MRQVTPSLKGGQTHKSQVLAPCEQSCCWEEILGEPLEPEREFSVSSHSRGFAFSPGLFLPVQLGQEGLVTLQDQLPALSKGQRSSLHLKCRIRHLL